MQDSKIEWTDHTFNPWMGCTKVSPGCKFCYAETLMDTRYGKVKWGPQGYRIRTSDANWRKPLAWNRAAEFAGKRARVFCASLADVFEENMVQLVDLYRWRGELWDLIDATPWLDWLLLTKRPENVMQMIPYTDDAYLRSIDDSRRPWPANVWIGTSVEDQQRADERIPALLSIPAAVRFLSVEPLLGPVDLTGWDNNGEAWLNNINWVIVGGESGPGGRPMHPDWARSLRDECNAAGVPFFFKQWGEWTAEPADGVSMAYRQMTYQHGQTFSKLGKRLTGRLLDGREWNEFPQPNAATSTTEPGLPPAQGG